jgi:raffinose/stachyose/melibiose transport system permease protein
VCTVVGGIFVSTLAAFPLAKFRFPGQQTLFFYFLGGLTVPAQVLFIPIFELDQTLHLYDSLPGIILPYIALGQPFNIFVLVGFFRGLPSELIEAARIDGATLPQILFQVLVPLARPAYAALATFQFLFTWNEFAFALILLQSNSNKTLPLGFMNFTSEHTANYGWTFAGATMVVIPIVIVYAALQRQFVSGLLAGSVKG